MRGFQKVISCGRPRLALPGALPGHGCHFPCNQCLQGGHRTPSQALHAGGVWTGGWPARLPPPPERGHLSGSLPKLSGPVTCHGDCPPQPGAMCGLTQGTWGAGGLPGTAWGGDGAAALLARDHRREPPWGTPTPPIRPAHKDEGRRAHLTPKVLFTSQRLEHGCFCENQCGAGVVLRFREKHLAQPLKTSCAKVGTPLYRW